MNNSIHNKKLVPYAKELRKNTTKEECHLWYDFLRTYPIKFTRQKVFGNYILDFYCAKADIAIEFDGSQHYEEDGMLKETIRTAKIEEFGVLVIRIPNNEVNRNFIGVCEYIDNIIKTRPHRF